MLHSLQNTILPKSLTSILAEMPETDRKEMESVWKLTQAPTIPFDTKQAGAKIWANLDAILDADMANTPVVEEKRPRLTLIKPAKIYYALSAAASVAVFVGVGYFFAQKQPATLQLSADVAKVVALPEGSKVDLAKGASLSFKEENGTRRAFLSGEGFFTVEHNGKPFIVETSNAEVKVLGTRFRVKSFMENGTPETTVHLESGKVALYAKGKPALYLEPGQTAEVEGNRAVLVSAPVPKSDNLQFNDETLGNIVATLEERFGTTIRLANDDMQQDKLTLFFKNADDLTPILQDIAAYQDYRIQKLSDGFLLKRK